MHPIVTLANEIPWIMAPASLIAAMTIISGIVVVMRYTEYALGSAKLNFSCNSIANHLLNQKNVSNPFITLIFTNRLIHHSFTGKPHINPLSTIHFEHVCLTINISPPVSKPTKDSVKIAD
jgi:hypothetical protein